MMVILLTRICFNDEVGQICNQSDNICLVKNGFTALLVQQRSSNDPF